MEGKLYQSRPRSVAHNSKKPKSKPRDENGSSLDHNKVWSRESNNGRQKQQRHERGSSILRKDQKKKGGRGEVDYNYSYFNSPFLISKFLNFQFQGEQGRHAANNREHHAALRYNKSFLEEVAQE